MVNVANSAFSNSPTAKGINLIQVWIMSCLVLIFITIAEYFFLLYAGRFSIMGPKGLGNGIKKNQV